jgi:hypothetical protein
MKYIWMGISVFVLYFVWTFMIMNKPIVLMNTATSKRVSGKIVEVKDKFISIEIDNNEYDNVITSVSMDRNISKELGIGTIDGLSEELMVVSEREKDNIEAIEWVKNYNKETIQWVGNLKLLPNQKTIIQIPIENIKDLHGRLSFDYERKVGFGGSMSSFYIDLAQYKIDKNL